MGDEKSCLGGGDGFLPILGQSAVPTHASVMRMRANVANKPRTAMSIPLRGSLSAIEPMNGVSKVPPKRATPISASKNAESVSTSTYQPRMPASHHGSEGRAAVHVAETARAKDSTPGQR